MESVPNDEGSAETYELVADALETMLILRGEVRNLTERVAAVEGRPVWPGPADAGGTAAKGGRSAVAKVRRALVSMAVSALAKESLKLLLVKAFRRLKGRGTTGQAKKGRGRGKGGGGQDAPDGHGEGGGRRNKVEEENVEEEEDEEVEEGRNAAPEELPPRLGLGNGSRAEEAAIGQGHSAGGEEVRSVSSSRYVSSMSRKPAVVEEDGGAGGSGGGDHGAQKEFGWATLLGLAPHDARALRRLFGFIFHPGWKREGGDGNCGMLRESLKLEGHPIQFVKGTAVVPASAEEMRKMVIGDFGEGFDAGSRVLDAMYDGCDILFTSDRDHVELLTRVRTPPMVKDRDFVFEATSISGLPNGGWAVHCQSVVRDDVPEDPKRVRGEILCNGWYCVPLREDEAAEAGFPGRACTRCTYVVCVDICGRVPSMAVNLMTGKQAQVVLAARRHFAQFPAESGPGDLRS